MIFVKSNFDADGEKGFRSCFYSLPLMLETSGEGTITRGFTHTDDNTISDEIRGRV